MHDISEDGALTIFLTTTQVAWVGEAGVSLNVANGLASALRDRRETTHLNSNPPLACLCQKEHTSKIQEVKLVISLIWGLPVGGVPLSGTHTPASGL